MRQRKTRKRERERERENAHRIVSFGRNPSNRGDSIEMANTHEKKNRKAMTSGFRCSWGSGLRKWNLALLGLLRVPQVQQVSFIESEFVPNLSGLGKAVKEMC